MNTSSKFTFIVLIFLFFSSCGINHYTIENTLVNKKVVKRGKWIEYCKVDTTFNKHIRHYNLNPYTISIYANCVNNYKKGLKHGKSIEFYSNGFYAIGKYYKGLKNGIWYIFDSNNSIVSKIGYMASCHTNDSRISSMMIFKDGSVLLNIISESSF